MLIVYIIILFINLYISNSILYSNHKTNNKKYPNIKNTDKFYLLISPFIFILLYLFKGDSIFIYFIGMLIPFLISQFIIDIREKKLSDRLNVLIAIESLIYLFTMHLYNSKFNVFSNIVNSFLLLAIYILFAYISNSQLGGGDIKFIGAIALMFPLEYFMKLLMYPFLFGTIESIYLLLKLKKIKNVEFSFAPSIIIAVIVISFL